MEICFHIKKLALQVGVPRARSPDNGIVLICATRNPGAQYHFYLERHICSFHYSMFPSLRENHVN